MKGRSHHPRLPPSEPPDDWGDGSWTVDCSCGVTFDDGEEMVSCDECGVWVHTRCARFVRGEASFACHKCKTAAAAATEETEVARVLVELPTKAADPGPPPPPLLPPLPLRRPYRPIEERVHVHGVPGGDPAIFEGVSSVFSPQLWKCAGYIPKKFNFPYREFPFWDEEDEGSQNPASEGADVLFSLSKEIVPCFPARAILEGRTSQEGLKKQEAEKVPCGRLQSNSKKERTRIHLHGANSGKRRKDESGEGKKRVRSGYDRGSSDNKKKRGSVPVIDINKAGLFDGGPREAEADVLDEKGENRKEDILPDPKISDEGEGVKTGSKPKHVFVIKTSRGGLSDEASRQRSSLERPAKVEKMDHPEPVVSREGSDAAKESFVNEDVSKVLHGLKQSKDDNYLQGVLNGSSCGLVIENSKPAISKLSLDAEDVDIPMVPHKTGATSLSSKLDEVEVKLEEGDDQNGKLDGMDHLPQHLEKPINQSSRNLQENEKDATLPSDDQKSQDAQRDLEASHQTCDDTTEGKVSRFNEPKLHEQVVESAGSSTVQRDLLEPTHGSKHLGSTILGCSYPSPTTTNVHKLVVGFGKASSASYASALSEASVSGSDKSLCDAASPTIDKAVQLTKQQRVKVTGEGDNTTIIEYAEESIQEISRQTENDPSKDSEFSGLKPSHLSRDSYASSKHTLSDSKEQLLSPPCKASTTENTTTGSLQTQKDSAQIKLLPSGPCQKTEKINQPVAQSSLKTFNHSIAMHPPASVNITATLSDEELALLLHHELNSSPRVPRVPRVRQTAGMQLAAPTATSMLKRSSSSGGKDQVSASRRKSKEDSSRDGSRSSRDISDETKRASRGPFSPDRKHQESTFITDGSSKKDSWNRSPDATPSFEATGQKGLSLRSSPRDVPNDVGTLTRRTLPGLIDEILSKGRRMTYDELCEAVRPHWLNLRKPNGERYAYSSHSHAVLDCLRNRTEWAHLVDRGPKTNSSKRRRKPDSDTPAVESENEEARNQAPMEEAEGKNVKTHREVVPKGKRNARKRRRLELRGKGVREPRKSSNQDAGSDDDPAAFSLSSNDVTEGNFSEDESQGVAKPATGNSTSNSSSDDTD